MRLDGRKTVLIVLAIAGLALTGCGRKGPLDTPYQAQIDARRDAIENEQQPVPPEPQPPVEDRRFVLDPLI